LQRLCKKDMPKQKMTISERQKSIGNFIEFFETSNRKRDLRYARILRLCRAEKTNASCRGEMVSNEVLQNGRSSEGEGCSADKNLNFS